MATAWQLHGSCMATAWQLPGESCCGCSGKAKCCMATAWQLHGKCMTNAWQLHGNCMATARRIFCVSQLAFFQTNGFKAIPSCLTTCVRLQTNGFKASRPVSQLVLVFKPMVLSHHVESHKFRLPKNQWLMYGFAVSPGNRFLKPMVLRHLVESQPMVLRRYFPVRHQNGN